MTTLIPGERDPFLLGSQFDLSLQLGPTGDTTQVAMAAEAVWTSPSVAGPWSVSSRIGKGEPLDPDPSERGRRLNKSRFGLLTITDLDVRLPFVLSLVHHASDWLTLGIPVAALRMHYPTDAVWSIVEHPWLVPLSRALAEVAGQVHACTPILTGVVGEEASGCWRSPNLNDGETTCQDYPPLAVISRDVVERRGGFVLPPDLWKQLGPQVAPVPLSSGLLYAPPRSDATLTGA